MSIEFNHNDEHILVACGFESEEEYVSLLGNIETKIESLRETDGENKGKVSLTKVVDTLTEKERVALILNTLIKLEDDMEQGIEFSVKNSLEAGAVLFLSNQPEESKKSQVVEAVFNANNNILKGIISLSTK